VPTLNRRRYTLLLVLAGVCMLVRPPRTHAGCNLIPQAQPVFRGSLGTLDRPFAGPGDFVEVHVRPAVCDNVSPGLGLDPNALAVTLLFTPPGGPKRAVLLTPKACNDAGVVAKLAACGGTPGVSGVSCVHMDTSAAGDMGIIVRADGAPRLRFRFPNTDALLAPDGDDHTLAGLVELDRDAVGQRTHDVEQLPRRHRDLAGIEILRLGPRDHLDFEIRTRQRNTARIDIDQEVRQHRQRLPALDDTDDLLQTSKEGFPLNAESHVALILSLVRLSEAMLWLLVL